LKISKDTLDAIVLHAREERPHECCGVLLGRGAEIIEAVRTRNAAQEPTRFVIDPQDHVRAIRDARGRGLDVVGYYHSHPYSAAIPSPRDMAEAAYPACVHLIASLAQEAADVRAFRIDTAGFLEEPLTLV
jgi:proteasome lid subunit RPN8/RPN11